MIFSQTAEYALRAIVWLADHDGAAQTTQQIAAATHVPPDYLSKVLQALGRADLVRSQRGLGGGFSLTREPEAITILQVINAVDPLKRITTCPLGLKTHGKNLCPLHRKLDDATAAIEEAFAATSVAEVLRTPTNSHPLCEATVGGRAAKQGSSRG
ncbi:MAG: Rrf2 family transcriptional regulator [Phycisphaeraceae bacterium]